MTEAEFAALSAEVADTFCEADRLMFAEMILQPVENAALVNESVMAQHQRILMRMKEIAEQRQKK